MSETEPVKITTRSGGHVEPSDKKDINPEEKKHSNPDPAKGEDKKK